jgi:DNA-binding transcriptional LysR family regulator
MTTIDLNLVATLVAVVDAGSFTAAARAAGVPTSSASRAVARLETRLGTRLLHRTTRRLHLTPAGEHYVARARAALADLTEAGAAVVDMGRAPRGKIRLSTSADLGGGVLTATIARFLARYPEIEIDVVVTSRWVDLVAEGFDLAVRGGALPDSSLMAHKLAATDFRLYAAPAYLQARGQPRRLADLARHTCIVYRGTRGPMPWRLHGPRGPEQVGVSGQASADDLEFVAGLVLAGAGIGMLPEPLAAPHVSARRLMPVLPSYAARAGALYVVIPTRDHVPARVALFRDHLIGELKSWLGTRSTGLPHAARGRAAPRP